MAKQIKFSYQGRDYVLEFNRMTVKQMESNGFNINEVSTKPMTFLTDLFAGAFKKNHRFVKAKDIDEMQELFADKDKLTDKLVEMYSETLESITRNSDDEDKANLISWSATE